MSYPELELSEVRMDFSNIGEARDRAERISKLTFDFLRELIQRELQHLDSDMFFENLYIPQIEISFESETDETIARICARRIYQSLMQAL